MNHEKRILELMRLYKTETDKRVKKEIGELITEHKQMGRADKIIYTKYP